MFFVCSFLLFSGPSSYFRETKVATLLLYITKNTNFLA